MNMKDIGKKLLVEAVQLFKGKPTASEDLQIDRIEVCLKCPFLTQYWGGISCGAFLEETEDTCGCDANEKVKYLDESCPQNKW
jgi:hypothetical protein